MVMAQIKNNLAGPQPTLAYRIVREADAPPRLDWLGPIPWTADQLAERMRRKMELRPRERARDFLSTILRDGALSTDRIWKAAQSEGLKRRTLEYARRELGIRSKRVFDGQGQLTWWLLPGQRLPESIPAEFRDDIIGDMLEDVCAKYPPDPLEPPDEMEAGEIEQEEE